MSDLLAIVIPYFKKNYFEATLSSLAAQTCQRFRVYIGNDASPDNPTDLLQQFVGKFDFDYHLFETNLGGTSLTQQWERCIARTKDEPWLMLLGDDDVLDKNVVAAFYEALPLFEGKSNVVRYATKIYNEYTQSYSATYTHPEWEDFSDFVIRRYSGQSRSSLSEYIFTRTAYQHYGFTHYPLAWHSDDRAWHDFSARKKIYSINTATLTIRISEWNISGKKDDSHLKSKASEAYFAFVLFNTKSQLKRHAKLLLLLEFEIATRRYRLLTYTEWLRISWTYLVLGQPYQALKALRRCVINTLLA